jgi:hypothetical protein
VSVLEISNIMISWHKLRKINKNSVLFENCPLFKFSAFGDRECASGQVVEPKDQSYNLDIYCSVGLG